MLIYTAFYAMLGSPRLSSLIQEDYTKLDEVTNSDIATKMRSLVLERLPLFLHEHSHSQLRHSYDWFSNHLTVKSFGILRVTKSLVYDGVSESLPEQPVFATAEWDERKENIELSLLVDVPDYNYE
jgi:hypothetical protein